MPIHLRYLDKGNGVLFLGEGDVTGAELISANAEIFSTPEKMTQVRYGLIDHSRTTDLTVTGDELRIMALQDRKASEHIAEAVTAIIAQQDLEFGLTRMWETILKNTDLKWETMAFRDREQAEAWLRERVKKKFDLDITLA